MRIDLSRRVSLFVLGCVGGGIVFEATEDGRRVPVHILSGPGAARRWTESHYEGVDWESPHSAVARVGCLSGPARLSASVVSGDTKRERRPRTYETAQLRTYLPELVVGSDGVAILQRGEEHVAEVDRWEPFVNVLWESRS